MIKFIYWKKAKSALVVPSPANGHHSTTERCTVILHGSIEH